MSVNKNAEKELVLANRHRAIIAPAEGHVRILLFKRVPGESEFLAWTQRCDNERSALETALQRSNLPARSF